MSETDIKRQITVRVSEKDALRACLDYLAIEHIWHMRMNTGVMKIDSRFIRFSKPGTADILFTIPNNNSTLIGWCEVKSSNGKTSDKQRDFQREVEREGHIYVVARSSDDLAESIRRMRTDAANVQGNGGRRMLDTLRS